MENAVGHPRSWQFICGLVDFFTSSGPLAILSIISDKCRLRHRLGRSVLISRPVYRDGIIGSGQENRTLAGSPGSSHESVKGCGQNSSLKEA
jgi:hypothetical protein